jgi:hypothetical protein
LAEEVLVIWVMYREGKLDRTTMQGLLKAIAAAMWEHVARCRHLSSACSR